MPGIRITVQQGKVEAGWLCFYYLRSAREILSNVHSELHSASLAPGIIAKVCTTNNQGPCHDIMVLPSASIRKWNPDHVYTQTMLARSP